MLLYIIHRTFLDLINPRVFKRLTQEHKGEFDSTHCLMYGLILHRHAPILLAKITSMCQPSTDFVDLVKVLLRHAQAVYPDNNFLRELTWECVCVTPGGVKSADDPTKIGNLEELLVWRKTKKKQLFAHRYYAYLPGASYSPSMNRIFIPGALWMDMYYSPGDLEFNLAGAGFILAHEMGHAIMNGKPHGELDADIVGAKIVRNCCNESGVDITKVFKRWSFLLQQSYKQCKYEPKSRTHPLNKHRVTNVADFLFPPQ